MVVFESKNKWVGAFVTVLLVCCFAAAMVSEIFRNSNEGTKELQSSSNSSMAAIVAEDDEGFNKHAVEDLEEIASMVDMSIRNSTEKRKLGYFSCGPGNPIDDCWRCDPNWHKNHKRLADCGIRFGRNAISGRDGYASMLSPTLMMMILLTPNLLKHELIMNSFKTIDGRGVNVHIANGGCITIQFVINIIIHGLHIYDCKPTGNALVKSSLIHFGWRTMADGDVVSIFGALTSKL
ncbi:hypothetical protein ACFX2I_017075 [Malus domestica]